jgi:signal transduction histidine kinase
VPGLESILTPGSCDAASLVALLLGATATAMLLVRLPRGVYLTFLPAILMPSWVLCGAVATVDIALVASLAAGTLRTRDTLAILTRGGVTIAGVAVGAAAGAAVGLAIGMIIEPTLTELGRIAAAAAFVGGYWLGEAAAAALVQRLPLSPVLSALPRGHIVANLLLLFPGLVLVDLLLARGPAYFVPMLLILVLALGLIALYISATTAREAVVQERARFVAEAAGPVDIPPDVLEERAMELTHELRSPLTAILGYAGLLAREGGDAARGRGAGESDRTREDSYVASITASSNYMLRLVNNILDLQRLESGSQALQLRPVDLSQFLEEAMAGVRPHADEKEVRTIVDVEPGLPTIITDELLLRRAVDNLLSNAVKYTRAGDSVRLSASLDGTGVAIAVEDTGIGLTREERDRLFERFFRGRRSEARIERGTGLGLTIVREATRMLAGEVRVDSTLGEGSTFTLWLPLNSSLPPEEAGEAP